MYKLEFHDPQTNKIETQSRLKSSRSVHIIFHKKVTVFISLTFVYLSQLHLLSRQVHDGNLSHVFSLVLHKWLRYHLYPLMLFIMTFIE